MELHSAHQLTYTDFDPFPINSQHHLTNMRFLFTFIALFGVTLVTALDPGEYVGTCGSDAQVCTYDGTDYPCGGTKEVRIRYRHFLRTCLTQGYSALKAAQFINQLIMEQS